MDEEGGHIVTVFHCQSCALLRAYD